jgi:hypothetical protein
MMAITTNNSTKVNPRDLLIASPSKKDRKNEEREKSDASRPVVPARDRKRSKTPGVWGESSPRVWQPSANPHPRRKAWAPSPIETTIHPNRTVIEKPLSSPTGHEKPSM